MKGWVALSGKVAQEHDPAGEQELKWECNYGKDPCVLTRMADSDWKVAARISFQIRSDREGRLFLRLDQKNKKIFLANFGVSNAWRQIDLSMQDFQPYGTSEGLVDPALLGSVYLVDLNGSDGGERGSRTVWLKAIDLPKAVSAGGSSKKTIPLVAFDSDGKVLGMREMARRGTSAGQWCFLTNNEGSPVPMKIVEQWATVDGKSMLIPAIVLEDTKPATLEVLYWPVGDEFKLWLQVDGRGQGIQNGLRRGVLLLNLELAHTRYRKLQDYLRTGGARFKDELRQIGEDLNDIEQETSLSRQALRADANLDHLLRISREAVRHTARAAVSSRMEPGPEISIPTPKAGLLLPGRRVEVRLEDLEFRVGMGQGFGFFTKREPKENVDAYYAELKNAGFNFATMPLYWDQIVDRAGNYTQWREILQFDTLVALGFAIHAHGFVQSGMPDAVKRLKGEEFVQAAKRHMAKVASDYHKRYGSSVALWQVINEPASNPFGGYLMAKRIRMVSDLIGFMRTIVPHAVIVVNDYDWGRGLEPEKPFGSRNISGSMDFYKELMRAENKPDVLSLEWYPGARVDRPEFGVDLAEPCMDLLDSSLYWDRFIALGLPLIFTESNFPGSMRKDDKNGYAWGRWDSASQAQAAVDTFLLALSKPQIIGWVWWSVTDDEPWQPHGGLLTAKGQGKPVLERLKAEIARLKAPKEILVKSADKLALPRLPGTYRISIAENVSWAVRRDISGNVSIKSANSK